MRNIQQSCRENCQSYFVHAMYLYKKMMMGLCCYDIREMEDEIINPSQSYVVCNAYRSELERSELERRENIYSDSSENDFIMIV